jgi:hypothetical protein
MSETIFKYAVNGFGNSFYCKVTELDARGSVFYSFAFGGKDTFCFIAAMDPNKDYIPYIDRVEYNESCVKEGSLDEVGGTAQLVKCALWTMKTLFPHITKFKLLDDSYIYCKRGSKEAKMSLAYDMIFKRNHTWYEDKFKAYLPSTLMEEYKTSVLTIDKPLAPFQYVSNIIPKIHKYKEEYESSSTPREFIQAIRNKYGKKYCFELDWLVQYSEMLGIQYFKHAWEIDIMDVHKPDGYELFTSTAPIKGGFLRHQTRKVRRKTGHGSVGFADTFEY